MNLARAVKAMLADPTVSCLAVVRDGKTGYVQLVHARRGFLQFRSQNLMGPPIMVPFQLDDLDPSQRTLVAELANETQWRAFRGGLPLEDEDALAKPKRPRKTRTKR